MLTGRESNDDLNIAASADKEQPHQLSTRQKEILSLLQEGKANKEIARELGIGLGTVKQHVVALFKKLNVTNRVMAVSKGLAAEGAPSLREPANDRATDIETALERRPVTVLSLLPGKRPKDADADFQRTLHRALSEVAFDFDAVLFANRHGGGDMIFGVEKTREHDVLRAVRAAMSAATYVAALSGGKIILQGGLSSGIVMASMERMGAWSGEAIAGSVIASTRELAAKAAPGTLALGESSRRLISFLGAEHGGGVPETVPFTRTFQWQLCGRRLETPLRGRRAEMKTMKACLAELANGKGGVILLEGESGIGKSALLWGFADHCADYEIAVLMRACPAPDSQPSGHLTGCLIRPGTSESLPVAKFKSSLIDAPPTKPTVILIDDTHFLPKEAINDIYHLLQSTTNAPVLFVLSGRNHVNLPIGIRDRATVIRLKRLGENHITEIQKNWLGAAFAKIPWICRLAAGVPVFAVELARHYRDCGLPENITDVRPSLPISLFVLVIARIDKFGLDRRLLRLAADKEGKHRRDDLLKKWRGDKKELDSALEKTIKAGLLQRINPMNDKNETIGFCHPLVHAVVKFAMRTPDRLK